MRYHVDAHLVGYLPENPLDCYESFEDAMKGLQGMLNDRAEQEWDGHSSCEFCAPKMEKGEDVDCLDLDDYSTAQACLEDLKERLNLDHEPSQARQGLVYQVGYTNYCLEPMGEDHEECEVE